MRLRFRNGLMLGTMMSAAGAVDSGGGAPAGGAAPAFASTLPEPLRAHTAFADVKDVGDLATRYANTQKPFAERLPEGIRNEAYFKDIKDDQDLATRAFNQAKMLGKIGDPNALAIVPTNDDEKGWNDLYGKLGRPESAEKYELPKLRADGKPYGEADVAFQKALLPVLHDAGLTQRQLAKIVPKWDEMMSGMQGAEQQQTQAAMEKTVTALKTEWGASFDEKIGLADTAIKHFSQSFQLGDGLTKELNVTNLGNNPAMAKFFAELGKNLKEDGLIGKAEGGVPGGLSPTEAKQQIAALEADKEKGPALMNKKHPNHAAVVAERQRLYEFAYPSESRA